jgi:transcriptional regulator with XRE-family HTH domain
MVKSFGDHLRRLRLDHPEKLSIREVSRRAGIDVSYLSRMEKGEVAPPREEIILRLADVLGAGDPDELLERADKIPPDVQEIIRDHYQEIPSFLRTAKDLSTEDWTRLRNYMQKNLLSRKDRRKR